MTVGADLWTQYHSPGPEVSLGRRLTGNLDGSLFLPGEENSKLPGMGKHCQFSGKCYLKDLAEGGAGFVHQDWAEALLSEEHPTCLKFERSWRRDSALLGGLEFSLLCPQPAGPW